MNILMEQGYVLDKLDGIWQRPEYEGIAYSDGDDVEQRLADVLSQVTDLSVMSAELRAHCIDWPSLYHFSASRANLLRPFEAELRGDVLEIGAGCGAVTRYLGECGGRVIALEGTRPRASIARARTRDLGNVVVVNEAFDRFNYAGHFDVVTLIGVLEYANLFTRSDNPPLTLLRRVRSLLKPDGKLILAIENQLGLKYLAGAPEDHLGIPMYGVEDRYRPNEPQTFGRLALEGLLNEAGFARVTTFAPFPDYKLPVSIITEEGFRAKDFDSAALICQSVRRDPQLPNLLPFAPELAWPTVVRNGLGLDLANSFLMIAAGEGSSAVTEGQLAWHFSTNRLEEYSKETQFVKTQGGSIEVSHRSLSRREALGIDAAEASFHLPEAQTYSPGRNFGNELMRLLSSHGWLFEDVSSCLACYIEIIVQEAALRGFNVLRNDPKSIVPGDLLDLTPQNIIIQRNGSAIAIDEEWVWKDGIQLRHLVYRSLSNLLNSLHAFGHSGDHFKGSRREFILHVMGDLGWLITDDDIRFFFEIEARFQFFATGEVIEWSRYEQWLSEQIPSFAGREGSEAELLSLRQRIDDLKQQLSENREELIKQRQHNQASERALEAVLQSTSWRVTAPARLIATALFKRFRSSPTPSEDEARACYIVEQNSIPVPTKPIVVLLPVYKDTTLTMECIHRALPAIRVEQDAKLLILNDCSPEADMAEALAEVQAAHPLHVELVSNPSNLGFVRTINRGFELAGDADVVLLNSDVLLPSDWLQRLKVEAYSHPRAGTVTPLSNNTTICTFPDFLQDNDLPLDLSVDAIDHAFKSERLPNVAAPTGIGFCMYMRHDCVQAVGFLNADDFPRGYGEENDFCQRAIAKGWLNLITPNLFAYHKGGVSFGEEKAGLVATALATIDKLHPRYHFDVRRFIEDDPLKAARITRLLQLLAQQHVPKVLHVTHSLGGGTHQHVLELSNYYLTNKKAFPLILCPGDTPEHLILRLGPSEFSDRLVFSVERDLEDVVALLKSAGISLVHYHHLYGLDEKTIGIAKMLGVKYYFTAHDYYMIGGNPTLSDEHGNFDPASPYSTLNPLYPILSEKELADFRERNWTFLANAEKVIFPSFAAKSLFDGALSLSNGVVAHHLEVKEEIAKPLRRTAMKSPIIVGVIGALSKEKGADFLEEIARCSSAKDLPFEFRLIGYAYRSLRSVHTTGPYEHSKLSQLLASEGVDVLFFPARVPETYSYTLSSSIRAGYPIMAPMVGAFPERLAGRQDACLFSLDDSVEDVLEQLYIFCEALNSGERPTAPAWNGGTPIARFYERSYLPIPAQPTLRSRPNDVAKTVQKLVKVAYFPRRGGWRRRLAGCALKLHQLPWARSVLGHLPLHLKAQLKRYLMSSR